MDRCCSAGYVSFLTCVGKEDYLRATSSASCHGLMMCEDKSGLWRSLSIYKNRPAVSISFLGSAFDVLLPFIRNYIPDLVLVTDTDDAIPNFDTAPLGAINTSCIIGQFSASSAEQSIMLLLASPNVLVYF